LNALWYYAIGFVLIWVIALLFRDKLKIDIDGPILLRKTTRLSGIIDSIAQKSPKIWRWVMNIGIVVAVFMMAFVLYYLIISLKTVTVAPQVTIALPGVQVPGSPIFVPFGFGLIALITVIVVHEFGHGILARAEKIDIKSVGVGMIAILPIAFVEPDDEQTQKLSTVSKLRIYAAGSIFNMMTAAVALGIFMLLSLFLIPYALPATGLEIESVVPGSPADGVLKAGMVIQKMNGYDITDRNSFTNNLKNLKVGDQLTIVTDQGTYSIKTVANPNSTSTPFIGVKSVEKHDAVSKEVSKIFGNDIPWALVYIQELLFWIYALNFGIGLINLLPLKPFDGGLIFEEIVGYWASKRVTRIATYAISLISLSLLVINIGAGLFKAII